MKGDLRGLTIARFVAAIAVVFFHYSGSLSLPEHLRNLIGAGYNGVSFFFVLSGFILVYVSHGRELQVRDFWVRRFARIYPVYFLAWALFGVWMIGSLSDLSLSDAAKHGLTFGGLSLVLLQSWVPHAAEAWNWPGWSLSTEAFFYACFPFLFVRLVKLNDRALWWIAGAAVLVSGVHVYLSQIHAPMLVGTPFESRWLRYLDYHPVLRLSQFVLGMVVGLHFIRHGAVRKPWLLAVTLLVITALLAKHSMPGLHRDVWLTPLFAVLVFLLAGVRAEGKVWEASVVLGKASYATYILQVPVWNLMWGTSEAKASAVEFAAYVAVLLIVSLLVYHYVETPLERAIKQRWGRRREARYAEAPTSASAES